jgi:hypothetical protein
MSYAICLSYKVVQTRKPHRCYGCAKLFPLDRSWLTSFWWTVATQGVVTFAKTAIAG